MKIGPFVIIASNWNGLESMPSVFSSNHIDCGFSYLFHLLLGESRNAFQLSDTHQFFLGNPKAVTERKVHIIVFNK